MKKKKTNEEMKQNCMLCHWLIFFYLSAEVKYIFVESKKKLNYHLPNSVALFKLIAEIFILTKTVTRSQTILLSLKTILQKVKAKGKKRKIQNLIQKKKSPQNVTKLKTKYTNINILFKNAKNK